jgi:hypothetical protein
MAFQSFFLDAACLNSVMIGEIAPHGGSALGMRFAFPRQGSLTHRRSLARRLSHGVPLVRLPSPRVYTSLPGPECRSRRILPKGIRLNCGAEGT